MDHDTIRAAIQKRYARFAKEARGPFAYPTGRASVERLGYPEDAVAAVPESVTARFAGVGNPFSLGLPSAGGCVVDVGCGAGFDVLIAAASVGPTGRVIGIDVCPDMLTEGKTALFGGAFGAVEFLVGDAAALPIPDASVDLLISNGVLNLAPCKAAAFRDIARVLKPGGRFQSVDLLLVRDLPPELSGDRFAWSN